MWVISQSVAAEKYREALDALNRGDDDERGYVGP